MPTWWSPRHHPPYPTPRGWPTRRSGVQPRRKEVPHANDHPGHRSPRRRNDVRRRGRKAGERRLAGHRAAARERLLPSRARRVLEEAVRPGEPRRPGGRRPCPAGGEQGERHGEGLARRGGRRPESAGGPDREGVGQGRRGARPGVRADNRLAGHYQKLAAESWGRQNASQAGGALNTAAAYFKEATTWTGEKANAAADTARTVSGKLIEGAGWVPKEVG